VQAGRPREPQQPVLVVLCMLFEKVEIYDKIDAGIESGPEHKTQDELEEAVDDQHKRKGVQLIPDLPVYLHSCQVFGKDQDP